jgi:hypothetical protein
MVITVLLGGDPANIKLVDDTAMKGASAAVPRIARHARDKPGHDEGES